MANLGDGFGGGYNVIALALSASAIMTKQLLVTADTGQHYSLTAGCDSGGNEFAE